MADYHTKFWLNQQCLTSASSESSLEADMSASPESSQPTSPMGSSDTYWAPRPVMLPSIPEARGMYITLGTVRRRVYPSSSSSDEEVHQPGPGRPGTPWPRGKRQAEGSLPGEPPAKRRRVDPNTNWMQAMRDLLRVHIAAKAQAIQAWLQVDPPRRAQRVPTRSHYDPGPSLQRDLGHLSIAGTPPPDSDMEVEFGGISEDEDSDWCKSMNNKDYDHNYDIS